MSLIVLLQSPSGQVAPTEASPVSRPSSHPLYPHLCHLNMLKSIDMLISVYVRIFAQLIHYVYIPAITIVGDVR